MSGEFDSRQDSHSTEFEQRPRILVKLSFRELCNSKLPGLSPFATLSPGQPLIAKRCAEDEVGSFDNMAISLIKKRLKSEKQAVSSRDTNP